MEQIAVNYSYLADLFPKVFYCGKNQNDQLNWQSARTLKRYMTGSLLKSH